MCGSAYFAHAWCKQEFDTSSLKGLVDRMTKSRRFCISPCGTMLALLGAG